MNIEKSFCTDEQRNAFTRSSANRGNNKRTARRGCSDHRPELNTMASVITECFLRRGNFFQPIWIYGLGLTLAMSLGNSASASNFNVTNTNDSGAGSLRQAIIDSNANPGPDDIAFSSVSGNIILTTGPIEITDTVNINGPGANVLAVDGNNASGIFNLDNVAANLSISDLTLTNAANQSAIEVFMVDFSADLTIQDCIISGNDDAIVASGAFNNINLTVLDSVISGNTSSAIQHSMTRSTAESKMIVRDSTISGNQGLGISMSEGTITVENSLVTGNLGRGIEMELDVYACYYPGSGNGSIKNSTISGNGELGIYAYCFDIKIENSTITDNDGGTWFYDSSVMIQNSIVAGNSAATGKPDLGGGGINLGWSLIQNPGSVVVNETIPGSNLIGLDPVLGPLQDNGGLSRTHALLSASPAINRGDPNFATPPVFDQRGPGFPRLAGGRVDIGAYESGSVQSGLSFLASLGDINADGRQDIAVLAHNVTAKTVTATIKDAENGNFIQHIDFNGNQIPVTLEVMGDVNNNGAPELVVLGQGSVRAEIRDSFSGALINTVEFSHTNTPVELVIVPDQNGNGIPELAVLGEIPVHVETRDALTGNLVSYVNFTDNVTPKDLLILPDLNGKGGPEIGVLGDHDDPKKADRVQIRDLLTGRWVRNLYFGKSRVRQALVVPDLDNNKTPEIAVLLATSGNVKVLVADATGNSQVRWIGYDPKYSPGKLLVLPDVNNNDASEIAVFGKNLNNQTQKAQLRDGKTKKLIRTVFFDKTIDPADLVVMPDINGNGASEIALLGTRTKSGLTRVLIKDSKSGALVAIVDF